MSKKPTVTIKGVNPKETTSPTVLRLSKEPQNVLRSDKSLEHYSLTDIKKSTSSKAGSSSTLKHYLEMPLPLHLRSHLRCCDAHLRPTSMLNTYLLQSFRRRLLRYWRPSSRRPSLFRPSLRLPSRFL
jgi:hypothetical protein